MLFYPESSVRRIRQILSGIQRCGVVDYSGSVSTRAPIDPEPVGLHNMESVRYVLLDIEGTICPISFVKDTLVGGSTILFLVARIR